jgi:hypothetical protein
MANLIGSLIGGLFVLGLLLGPGVGLYLVSRDTIRAMQYEGKSQGIVESCTSIKTGSSSQTRYHRVPKVRLDSGQLILGTVDEVRFLWVCEDQVGRVVEVLYDRNNPKKAKLNTFLEMWFMPSLMLILCVIWYPLVIKGYLKKIRRKA